MEPVPKSTPLLVIGKKVQKGRVMKPLRRRDPKNNILGDDRTGHAAVLSVDTDNTVHDPYISVDEDN